MLVIEEGKRLPEKGILVEEPEVAEILSSKVKVVEEVHKRGYHIYISDGLLISTHGVGGPSLALILEELIRGGVKVVMRYGTAGSFSEDAVGKYFIAIGVSHHYNSSLYQRYRGDIVPSLFPDLDLAYSLYKYLKEAGKEVLYGELFQSDDFYQESHLVNNVVDMESGTLYLISRQRGIKAVSLLILANYKGKWIDYEEIYRRDGELVINFLKQYKGS